MLAGGAQSVHAARIRWLRCLAVVAQGSWAAWDRGTGHKAGRGPRVEHHWDIFTVCYSWATTGRGKRVVAGGLRSNDLKGPGVKPQTSGWVCGHAGGLTVRG